MNKNIYLCVESCFLLFIRPDWEQLISELLTKGCALCPPRLLWPRHQLWLCKQLRCQSSLLLSAEKIQTICAFLCFYYAHTKDSKTAFVLRLKQMYTGCHITFFCRRTQFSCSQNTERNSGCHVPKNNNKKSIVLWWVSLSLQLFCCYWIPLDVEHVSLFSAVGASGTHGLG